jgi:hypothetical protein
MDRMDRIRQVIDELNILSILLIPSENRSSSFFVSLCLRG